uniref:Uncharacterized protein n=1 Tax=Arundo donax TaxID=35708 RepID=A0A0A9HR03_ARUDO
MFNGRDASAPRLYLHASRNLKLRHRAPRDDSILIEASSQPRTSSSTIAII